ncbi:uncharacterized protein LOC110645812 isoform X2 [Hevea brasiliensis]|uniref:uncharacterized protein LOC110645812 isoform X2 n=1 Tax=Hevea brasiliensis TaxID=3981 RepID=UPI0025FF371E|nr:uncharacterized protein LOC110645812 isoform X2 [Hevea brasiliensis]
MAKTAKGAGSDKKAKKKNKKNKKSGPSTVAMKLKTPKDNPFETIWSRRKFDILGKKRGKGEERRIGLARSLAIDKRKKTLLKEFEQSGKSSVFVDKRIGEKNDELGEFDKAIMRSQRERQLKLSKKSKYNLSDGEEEDLEIQGFGPLLERDDFDDEMLSDDDKDDAEADETRRKSANLKQLNDHDTPNQVEQGMVEGEENKHKTKKEVMEEVILKSKFFKAQKAKDKEENEKLMEELDKSFTSLVQSKVLLSLTEPGKMNALKALVNQSIPNEHLKKDDLLVTQKPEAFSQGKPDSYDKLVKEMSLDIRAYPSDRTKTPEEIAQEERERLERLEEERQKRMLATNDSSDEENDDIEMPLTQRPRSISGDDLGDSFSFHEEPKARKGWVDEILERRDVDGSDNEDDNSSEDSESAEDDGDNEGSDESDNSEDKDESDKTLSLKDWEQSDDDNLGTDLEGDEEEYNDKLDDEDEAIEPRGYKKSKKNDNVETREGNGESLAAKNIKQCSTEKEIPFLIEAPKSFEELCALLDNCSNANVMVVINRIRASNAIKLAAENRKKMQVFYGVLLQYFAVLANRKPLNFELLNFLVKPLIEMSMEIPYFSAICARQRILHTRTQFCESLKNSENGCWPSMKTLCLLRLWSMIFPCSDLRHVVMTPAILLMCEYLMRCPIMSGRDIAVGSFLCSMVLSVVKQSKKFCPEAIMFLQSLLMAAIERKQASYHESQFYHLVELKALGPVLFIRHCVNEISPLNFFMIMDMPEDSAFLSSDNFRASVLVTVIETLQGYVDVYEGLNSFPEIFLPISTLLLQVAKQEHLPAALQDKYKNVAELIKKKAEQYTQRLPLQMRKKKPLPIKLLTPKFEENFVKGRDYDPDRERAEGRKLKKQLKREAKGAARELRKDNYFLYEVKEKEKALMEEERAEKYGQSRAFLQEQEHAFKSGQLGKGSKRRR